MTDYELVSGMKYKIKNKNFEKFLRDNDLFLIIEDHSPELIRITLFPRKSILNILFERRFFLYQLEDGSAEKEFIDNLNELGALSFYVRTNHTIKNINIADYEAPIDLCDFIIKYDIKVIYAHSFGEPSITAYLAGLKVEKNYNIIKAEDMRVLFQDLANILSTTSFELTSVISGKDWKNTKFVFNTENYSKLKENGNLICLN